MQSGVPHPYSLGMQSGVPHPYSPGSVALLHLVGLHEHRDSGTVRTVGVCVRDFC